MYGHWPTEYRTTAAGSERSYAYLMKSGEYCPGLVRFLPEETMDTVGSRAMHSAGVFERQDSLARAASLQECDRARDPAGILNFLESTMNIEDYLEDITQITGVPAEDIDFDEIELQKCNLLYNEGKCRDYGSYDPFAHNDVILRDQIIPQDDYVCEESTTSSTPELVAVVKEEPAWEGNIKPSTSSTRQSRRTTRNVQPVEPYTPTTTARKYRLKTPQERNNISYKVKRQRNNDAVRKSRSKAKQMQMMKEKQLEDALKELENLRKELCMAREKLARCHCQQ